MTKYDKEPEMRNRWISGKIPEDLEYTDDLALIMIPHSFNHKQEKTQRSETVATLTGLRINNYEGEDKQLADGYIDKWCYWWSRRIHILGSVVSTTGGNEQDDEARLGKTYRSTFRAVDKLWKSQIIGKETKVKISNSNDCEDNLTLCIWVLDD